MNCGFERVTGIRSVAINGSQAVNMGSSKLESIMEDYFVHVLHKAIQICSKKFLLINHFTRRNILFGSVQSI
jgi:hypothetical protein